MMIIIIRAVNKTIICNPFQVLDTLLGAGLVGERVACCCWLHLIRDKHTPFCVCVCVCVRACVCVCEGGHVVESSGWFPWPQGEPGQYQHTSRRLIKPLYQFTVIIMTACPSEQEYSRAQPCHAMPQNEISIPLTVDTVAIELHLESHHVSVRACVFECVHLVFVHRPLV